MPVNDPIGDLLTRIRNAQSVRNLECRCPWSRHKQEICEVLQKERMLGSIEVVGEGIEKEIVVTFSDALPNLTLKRVSKPGRRVYLGKGDIKPVLQGFGVAVITTSQGVMTDKEARKKKIGGEILCTVS